MCPISNEEDDGENKDYEREVMYTNNIGIARAFTFYVPYLPNPTHPLLFPSHLFSSILIFHLFGSSLLFSFLPSNIHFHLTHILISLTPTLRTSPPPPPPSTSTKKQSTTALYKKRNHSPSTLPSYPYKPLPPSTIDNKKDNIDLSALAKSKPTSQQHLDPRALKPS